MSILPIQSPPVAYLIVGRVRANNSKHHRRITTLSFPLLTHSPTVAPFYLPLLFELHFPIFSARENNRILSNSIRYPRYHLAETDTWLIIGLGKSLFSLQAIFPYSKPVALNKLSCGVRHEGHPVAHLMA